jgi:hypothetical protein
MMMMAVVVAMTGTAAADKPAVKDVKDVVLRLKGAVGSDGSVADAKAAKELVATPFTYEGFAYSNVDDKLQKSCKKKGGAKGTVKAAELDAFFNCMSMAIIAAALDGDADWHEVDLAKLPAPVKKLKTQLAKLAGDHVLVISHFQSAGPAEDWNVYAVKQVGGKLVVSAWFTVDVCDGCGT